MPGLRNDNKKFTAKQSALFPYLARGLSDRAIASEMGVTVYAVYNHRQRIMDITGCLTIEELRQYAKERME